MTSNLQGPTLSDSIGLRRIRKLEDSVLNAQCQILERLENIDTMNHEIRVLKEKEAADAEFIAGLMEKHGRY